MLWITWICFFFLSYPQTDTEVVAHLVHSLVLGGLSLTDAVAKAIKFWLILFNSFTVSSIPASF